MRLNPVLPAGDASNDAVLEIIAAYGRALTRRHREVLRKLADAEDRHELEDGLVCEGVTCYIGEYERVSPRTRNALLRACAIRLVCGKIGGYEVWAINETGRTLVGKPKPPREART